MATHSSIYAWKIPWTEEPGGLQSMGSQRVGHNWATSVCVCVCVCIGQYAPVFLPGEPHSLTEKPGRPQSTGSQRAGHYRSNPACIDVWLFLPVAALPQWELSVTVTPLLGWQGPWRHQVFRDRDGLCHRSYGSYQRLFRASGSWRSEGLFGRSFSVALPIQALRGLPCLGSFSV